MIMNSRKDGKDVSSLTAMQRITLFLDGLSRTAIFPFGPKLIHRILISQDDDIASTWSQVAYPFAITVGMYSFGRWVGTVVAERMPIDHSKLNHLGARLGGATFALHLFSYGAGLGSIFWLVMIRFMSGLLSGFLCRITNARMANEVIEQIGEFGEELAELPRHGTAKALLFYTDGTSTAATTFTAGFTLSLLLGGVFYESAQADKKFQAFTGAEPYTLSPMFFVVVSVVGEACLRLLFWYVQKRGTSTRLERAPTPKRHNMDRVAGMRRRKQKESLPSLGSETDLFTAEDGFFEPLGLSRHATPVYLTPCKKRSFSKEDAITPSRSRLNTGGSTTSEFFDCESFGDIDDIVDMGLQDGQQLQFFAENVIEWGENSQTDVSVYRNNKCVYENGSPAFVPVGECESVVPDNFVRCWGDRKATKMWHEMQQWRKRSDIWRLHTGPHRLFPKVKDAYSQHFHGFSKKGLPMLYEKPGKMKLKELFQSGVTVEEMTRHYFFMMEYISNVLCLKDEILKRRNVDRHRFSNWNFSVVMDVEGISMSMVSKDVIKYMTNTGDVNTRYYPLTTGKVFVVNAPFWLAGVWSGMKSLAPDSLTVEILSKSNSLATLLEYIDEDQIPKEYGGTSPYPTEQHPYELELSELVMNYEMAPDFESQPLEDKCTGMVKPHSYSFDYSDQKWIAENSTEQDDFSRTLNSGTWKPELSSSPSLRQRSSSVDRQRRNVATMVAIDEQEDMAVAKASNTFGILAVSSCMYFLWYIAHGAIECLIPLYVLTPPILGGLGYLPARGGFSLFCASILIQWLVRTKLGQLTSQIPTKAPMRALRTGVGTEMVILIMLPLVPNSIVSVARVDSVVNMVSTILLVSGLAMSSMMGMTAISILHRIACENYVTNPMTGFIARIYGPNRLLSDCQTGKLTSILQSVADLIGIMIVAPLYSWSTLRERPAPFDASLCFFALSLVSFISYILSFSLQLNVVGEFVEPTPVTGTPRRKQTCALFGDAVTVPVSDITALLGDANMSFARERFDSRSFDTGLEMQSYKNGIK
jgi:CRAL/TRIO domain